MQEVQGVNMVKAQEKPKIKAPRGSSKWVKDWRDVLCARVASGMSMRSVLLSDDMPSGPYVYEILEAEPDFAKRYARACEERADALVDELLDIADDGSNDWMAKHDPDNPGFDLNGEHIQRSKVRVDARKWLVGKLDPKKYGDKLAIDATVTGPEMSDDDKIDRFLAQVPVLNSILAARGLMIQVLETDA